MRLRAFGFGGLLLAAASVASSLVHPWGNVRGVAPGGPIFDGSAVPGDVRTLLEKKCADCHSNQTRWPVYSRLAPGSWLMERDVKAGRSAANFSLWAGMSAEDRIDMLARISAQVRSGEMPPKPYAMVHAAFLSDRDKQQIALWARAERKRIKAESTQQKESENK